MKDVVAATGIRFGPGTFFKEWAPVAGKKEHTLSSGYGVFHSSQGFVYLHRVRHNIDRDGGEGFLDSANNRMVHDRFIDVQP